MNPFLEHSRNRWGSLRRLFAVSLDKVLALVSHSMLRGHSPSESRDAVHRFLRNRFRVVEEPVQAGKRCIAVYLFEYIKCATDGLVIRRMHAPWPAIFREYA